MSDKPIRPQPSWNPDTSVNRAYEMRRDLDTVKTPKITIYDIDYAIMYWIQNVIAPTITEDGNVVNVPLVYGNGEKWAQVQANGFLRDSSGKQMTPIMILRRTSMAESDRVGNLTVNANPGGNNLLMIPQRSRGGDPYDVFSKLYNSKIPHEYYITALPEFVDVEYELIIWTEYVEQMNHVVQDILPTSRMNWGDTWRFVTEAEGYTFETVQAGTEDRIVRCTIPLKTQGILLDDFEMKKSNIQKAFSLKRVVWNDEKSTFSININDIPPGGFDNDMRLTPSRRSFFQFLLESGIKIG